MPIAAGGAHHHEGGFHNLAYFNRVFRQQLGESPSAYRRRMAAS
ncbi:MAG: AraC family transcriptional regulator [Janthinobacterium lividum]